MARVYVDVDEDDVLAEVSTEWLEREIARRNKRDNRHPDVEPQSIKEANQSLDDAAFALRQAGKINLAWRLDEIRFDYFKETK